MDENEMAQNTRITDDLTFHYKLKAYLDIISSHLIIMDPLSTKKVIFRTSFKNDPNTIGIDINGNAIWTGRDNEQRLVLLNRTYEYILKIEDKLGREFVTTPQEIYLKCDLTQIQQLQVHLNKFDSVDEYFDFNKDRMIELAKELCLNSLSSKIKFRGYACEIGKFEYNLNLAYFRAKTFRERFLEVVKRVCPDQECYENCIKRVEENLTKKELAQKFEGYPDSFSEPLKLCDPCTLKEIMYLSNTAYGRNLSRRVDIILFNEKILQDVARKR